MLLIFHRLLRQPLIEFSPRRIQPWLAKHAVEFHLLPLSRLLLLIIFLLIGIGSHLLWDSFTHDGGWALRQLGWDTTHVKLTSHYELTLANVLQDLSSFCGLLVIVVVLLARIYSKHASPSAGATSNDSVTVLELRRSNVVAVFAVIALLPAAILFARNPMYWLHNERRQLLGFVAVLMEIVAYSIIWRLSSRASKRRCLKTRAIKIKLPLFL